MMKQIQPWFMTETVRAQRRHLTRQDGGGGRGRLPKTAHDFIELYRGKLLQTQKKLGGASESWGEENKNRGHIQVA